MPSIFRVEPSDAPRQPVSEELVPMSMMRARCHRCGWIFDVVALPMPVDAACRAMLASRCPMCANSNANMTAPSRELTAEEVAQKRLVMAKEIGP